MPSRKELVESIATRIADYRDGQVEKPSPEHVDRWIRQFDSGAQEPMLAELNHVFEHTYFSKQDVHDYLAGLAVSKNVAGPDPASFWKGCNFLTIQLGGNSQRDMLAMFEEVLRAKYGLSFDVCGSGDSGIYIYLDDAIFTGHRVWCDIAAWIESSAPAKAKVHVIVMALNAGGEWFAKDRIDKAATAAGKTIETIWWRSKTIKNRLYDLKRGESDILAPSILPEDPATAAYVDAMKQAKHPPELSNWRQERILLIRRGAHPA
jgi:hypothetical protein